MAGAGTAPQGLRSGVGRAADAVPFIESLRNSGIESTFVPDMRISEAAAMLGVSDDTVRRWLGAGRLQPGASRPGPRTVDGASVAAAMADHAYAPTPHVQQSARNRFPGIVTRVERDGVMALVEIQAGPHRVTSLLSRESADELGLAPGVRAVGVVKSTNVVIELEEQQ
jgi:molybdopterin-binding protein